MLTRKKIAATLPNKFPNQNEEKLFRLIENYDLSGLKEFLKDDSQVDLLEMITPDGKTVLHYAVIKNEESIVACLLNFVVFLPFILE